MKIKSIQYHIIFLLFFLLGCGQEENDLIETQEPLLGEFIEENTFRVYPQKSDNFSVAEFRLWVPEQSSGLKAILVLLNSHNSNALGMANSLYWQKYANQERLAIIGVHFKTTDNPTKYYAQAEEGSGRALLEGLNNLAKKYKDLNLENLPFLLRGYSAGGVFSHSFSAFQTERVIAFANIRGGGLYLANDANKSVLGMMFYGENDLEQRRERITEIVELKREIGGLWCMAEEPNVDHFGGLNKTDDLIQTFFSLAIEKRVQENSNELLNLDEGTGWLGNHVSLEVASFEKYPGSKMQASWLFNEKFAILWREFQLK